MFEVIAFDADDTLWHNEGLYTGAQERLKELLAHYHEPAWIDERLAATELNNLEYFGYGIKGFTLSMIETAVELTEGRITGPEIEQILGFAKEMLRAPVRLLDHVEGVIDELAGHHDLMVITKGDLFDQESKIARSGIAEKFGHIEILSEKTPDAYERVFAKHGLDPEVFVMVGNSMRSDVIPVIEAGGNAIHVPYVTTWAHEAVDDISEYEGRYVELGHIGELPAWLQGSGDAVQAS